MAIKVLVEEKTPQGLELKDLILSICGSYQVRKDYAETTVQWFKDRNCQPLKYESLRVQLASHDNVATQLYAELKKRYASGMAVEVDGQQVNVPSFEDC